MRAHQRLNRRLTTSLGSLILFNRFIHLPFIVSYFYLISLFLHSCKILFYETLLGFKFGVGGEEELESLENVWRRIAKPENSGRFDVRDARRCNCRQERRENAYASASGLESGLGAGPLKKKPWFGSISADPCYQALAVGNDRRWLGVESNSYYYRLW